MVLKGLAVKRSAMFFLCLWGLLCFYCSHSTEPEAQPEFILEDVNGVVFKLSDQLGKVAVAEFFSIDCSVCQASVPAFNNIYNIFKDSSFVLVGVSVGGHHVTAVKGFQSSYNILYKLLIDNGEHTDGKLISQSNNFFVSSVPTTFFIDKKGAVRLKHEGSFPQSEYEKIIQDLLKE
jgi:peroxiredoxin